MQESKTVEFKEKITNSFLKTVSAFANYNDGVIVFGVDDSGNVLGLENPEEICLRIENMINDSIEPRPKFWFGINQEDKTVELHIEEGEDKPFFYKGKVYRRSDTSTVEVDKFELKRLVMEGLNIDYESVESREKDLKFETLGKYLNEKLGIGEVNEDIAKTLGLINDNNKYVMAAELLADTNKLPGIDVARMGKDINTFIDRRTFAGESILSQYEKCLDMFKLYYQYEEVDGAYRTSKDMIPYEAFREALVNALIHREWDVRGHTKVAMYEDRIEITSYGGLPRSVSKESFCNGESTYVRNPIISNVFFRLGLAELFATGIKRINKEYQDKVVKPSYKIYDNIICIILPVVDEEKVLTLAEETVYNVLKHPRRIMASSEIVQETGFSKDKVVRILNSLREYHYIKAIGNGRGTKYDIT